MKVKNYKRLAVVITAAIIILLVIMYFIAPKLEENNNIIINNNNTIDSNNMYSDNYSQNYRLIENYTNPTANDVLMANMVFGSDNYEFVADGILVKGIFNDEPETKVLFSDIWFENDVTSKFVKPNTKDFILMTAENYIKINLYNVSERDVKKYINNIKELFERELHSSNSKVLYRGCNSNEEIVEVEFYKASKEAIVTCRFN